MLKLSVTALYTVMTLATIALLVLLRMDGVSSKAIVLLGFLVLGPSAILFRFAHANLRNRKWFERYLGAAFVVLVIAHYVFDKL